MKIAYTSDIHVDSSGENLHIPGAILKHLHNNKPDVFVITGDVSHSMHNLDKALAVFKSLSCPKLFIPGNHDIWIEKDYPDSYAKYFEQLPHVIKKNGFIPVWTEPFMYGEYGFCGSMGWYDYSFKPHNLNLSENDYEQKIYADHTWMDKMYARFIYHDQPMTDKEVTLLLFDNFKDQYEKINKKTNKIIALFHHMPFKKMIRHRYVPTWNFFATYMGSDRFGDFLLAHNNITLAIHGHYHRKYIEIVPRQNSTSSITVASSPFGYFRSEGKHPVNDWYRDQLSYIEV